MTADIILGLQYGDEGKGTTVDFLCTKHKERGFRPIVIRFSGGPQAGHTTMVNKKIHIHSSFGSGTARHNVPSYFSEHTLIYPPAIKNEIILFKKAPYLYIHPLAKLITPFDVINNRKCKDNQADGTCGMGIGKAMKRQEEGQFKFFAIDLQNPTILFQKMKEYIRINKINLLADDLLTEIELFKEAVLNINWKIKDYSFVKDNFDSVIFEGSQGILLDKDHGVFPHVTYANTTSKNALEICNKLNIFDNYIYTYYITRAYSTRHGNGPFKESKLNLINTENETNIDNYYQGNFKIGEIDYMSLSHAIAIDNIYNTNFNKILVVTCLDQIDDKFKFEYDKLNIYFIKIYNSFSPDSTNFKILPNNMWYNKIKNLI